MPTVADPVEFTHRLENDASDPRRGSERCGNHVQLEDGTNTPIDATNPLDVDVQRVAAPNVYNVTLTLADTEYNQALPANTKVLCFQCRTAVDVRFAFETGRVAVPVAPYMTLKANHSYVMDTADLAIGTLYLASSVALSIVEIEAWA